jgi:hypothetical protein
MQAKKKTTIKVRDLKPLKDAKGGVRLDSSHGTASHGTTTTRQ